MKSLPGFGTDTFPYASLQKVSDLLYYEGPILSHFTNERRENFFYFWVDYNDNYNRWLVFQVKSGSFVRYLNGGETLRNIILDTEYIVGVDIDDSLGYHNCKFIPSYALPTEYIPEVDSYFKFEVPETYHEFVQLKDNLYVETLRENSINFKLISPDLKYKHLLKFDSLIQALNNIKLSYRNYFDVSFAKTFSGSFVDSFESIKRRIIGESVPLIVDLDFQSFSVSLAPDPLTRVNQSKEIVEWKKNTFEGYQEDVIYAEFDSEQFQDRIISKFSPDERRKIYRPIIQTINSNKVTLSVTGKSFSDIQKSFKRINKSTETKLLPPAEKKSEKEVSIYSVIALGMGGDDFSKSSIKDILASQKIETFKISQPIKTIKYEDEYLTLNEGVEYELSFAENVFTITFPALGIEVSADHFKIALEDFCDAAIRLYKKYVINFSQEKDYSQDELAMREYLNEIVFLTRLD